MANTDTQHTSRPWKYSKGLINTYVRDITGKDNYRLIADVDFDSGQTTAERDYIGNLIAVAPELLACLEASTIAMISEREDIFDSFPATGTDTEDNEEPSGERYFELCSLIDANQAVLAKATGGDS